MSSDGGAAERPWATSLVAVGFFVTAAVLGLMSMAGSSRPDGLERVAIDNSISLDGAPVHPGRLADYAVPWWDGVASGAAAAAIGIALCAGAGWAVFRLVLRGAATAG